LFIRLHIGSNLSHDKIHFGIRHAFGMAEPEQLMNYIEAFDSVCGLRLGKILPSLSAPI
jgi:hypothetical protein